MEHLRAWANARLGTAVLVLLLALGVRFAVPAGFMPMHHDGAVVLTLCSGHGAMMLGHRGNHDDAGDRHDQPCGFGALSLSATGGADSIQLAAAIAYVEAREPAALAALPVRLAARLRPPLRAPPV